jgi:dimethylhistidine N-methyltransferase
MLDVPMLDAPLHEASRIAFYDHSPEEESFREAVLAGLSRPDRAIPCRFLYDERGSALFDRICEIEEYYPTRTETSILTLRAAEIARLAGPAAQLIELGSGSSVKVRTLLAAMEAPAAYIAVDISREHLRRAAEELAADAPHVKVAAICADYSAPFPLPALPEAGRRMAFFPGSTIGNLEPDEALAFLRTWARRLGPGAAMLIGVDLRKDPEVLRAAYDDPGGVTAAFTLNLLARANAELDADFDLDGFAHHARYDQDKGRIEIHLRSLRPQSVRIGEHVFAFEADELIHAEHSYKYAVDGFQELSRRAGFQPTEVWTDAQGLFSVHYLTTPDG